MKPISILACLAHACLLWAMTSPAAYGQSYSITSGNISAGGGTSSGGAYSVTGSIGQQDAGSTSGGGAYSFSGGFFGQYMALQQIGAPHIVIRTAAGGNVQVVWGANVLGWILQANAGELAPNSWVDVVGAPIVSGAEQFHQFAATGGRVFFRLRKL